MPTRKSNGWRLAILVATDPTGSVMFAVQGLAGLVSYHARPDEALTLGGLFKVQVSVSDGSRMITDVVPAADGHGGGL